jgi:hypothetical protein
MGVLLVGSPQHRWFPDHGDLLAQTSHAPWSREVICKSDQGDNLQIRETCDELHIGKKFCCHDVCVRCINVLRCRAFTDATQCDAIVSALRMFETGRHVDDGAGVSGGPPPTI